jgi:hypothetical protein
MMIQNDNELQVMMERIRRIQNQLSTLRKAETNPTNYRLSSSGFIAELDRMQLEVREYLALPPQLAKVG